MSADAYKRAAAAAALDEVQNGMLVGLGTGSTAAHFIDLLAERVRAGLRVRCVSTSEATRMQALNAGLEMVDFETFSQPDLTIDGADEIDPSLTLIKGGGGALLREKIVASASCRMIVIADASKYVPKLGAFPLPIEVVPFGLAATRRALIHCFEKMGCQPALSLRKKANDEVFLTDGGHYILDAACGVVPDPKALGPALVVIPGVVEHGLFVDLASRVFLADAQGVRRLEKS